MLDLGFFKSANAQKSAKLSFLVCYKFKGWQLDLFITVEKEKVMEI